MTSPYVIPTNPRWNEALEMDLCAAVATVLQNHGLKHDPDNESIGWTPEMAAEFAALMQRHVSRIKLKAFINPTSTPYNQPDRDGWIEGPDGERL
jgi:hypothetical protein